VEVVADLRAFVNRGLLTTHAEDGHVEVALRHQHFLVAWPPLREKIEEEKETLQEREALATAAGEWNSAGRFTVLPVVQVSHCPGHQAQPEAARSARCRAWNNNS
jgi:hypothetical protein